MHEIETSPLGLPTNQDSASAPVSGFYQAEPDFPANGVWVSVRAVFAVRVTNNQVIELEGLYFPEMTAKQSGNRESTLVFEIDGKQVHSATLRKHGAFRVRFDLRGEINAGRHELAIKCSNYFVPALIGEGSDERKLAWRFKRLRLGGATAFDCRRSFNYLEFNEATAASTSDDFQSPLAVSNSTLNDGADLCFHLDSPQIDLPQGVNGLLKVDGWAFNSRQRCAAKVRLLLDDEVFYPLPVERQDVQKVFGGQFPLPIATGFSIALAPPEGMRRVRIEVSNGVQWIPFCSGLLFRSLDDIAMFSEQRTFKAALDWVLSIPRFATKLEKTLCVGDIRFNLDKPRFAAINVIKEAAVFSGWAVNLRYGKPARVRFLVGKKIHAPQVMERPDVQQAFASISNLPFDTGFALSLTLPIGVHRMWIEVEAAPSVWAPLSKTLLIRVPGATQAQRHQPVMTYAHWTQLTAERLKAELPDIERHISVMIERPSFTVVVRAARHGKGLGEVIQSVRDQIYPYFDICVLLPPGGMLPADSPPDIASINAIDPSAVVGTYVVFLESWQRLAINALYEFASAINQDPKIDLVYGDEDRCNSKGVRFKPFHKPCWSPDYLETFNYIGFTACFRVATAAGCFDAQDLYDFVLRFTENSTRVRQVPKVLGHALDMPAPRRRAPCAVAANERSLDALSGRLRRTCRTGWVGVHPLHEGCFEIRLTLQASPLVSIIIPSAGKTIEIDGRRIDLLPNIVSQIRERSTYKNVEIIVVDNGDLTLTTIEMLTATGCKRITYTEPVFNISKKLNLGATLALGEMFLLMNDDIEILTPDWIERLLEQFEKPHVGVVGAKLLYPSGATQHVGVAHNGGNPDHVRRLFPRDDAGYYFSTCGVRNFSAVTGACMMTRASVYRKVGGYSEELAVSFNDVDYCLKVRRKGLYVVYAPAAELTHMESVSRVGSLNLSELLWYHRNWAAELAADGFYPERYLTIAPPSFEPSINERMI
jgi:GT2 family glycosyltransferase